MIDSEAPTTDPLCLPCPMRSAGKPPKLRAIRLSSASRGYATFATGPKKAAEQSEELRSKPRSVALPTDEDIRHFFIESGCCTKKDCFTKHFLIADEFSSSGFSIDFTNMYKVVKRYRNISLGYTKQKFDEFAIGKIRECMTLKPTLRKSDASQQKIYRYDWKLGLPIGTGEALPPVTVCRGVFQFCWGITDHHRQQIIASLGESEDGYNAASSARAWDDHSRVYEGVSSDRMAKICTDNIVTIDESVGERTLTNRAGK